MDKEQITEGNKLIAEFMGYKYYPYEAPDDPSQQPKAKADPVGWIKGDPKFAAPSVKGLHKHDRWLCRLHRDLRYFNEWDWLMPVVEKIESLWTEVDGHFGVYICSNGCTIQGVKFRSDFEPFGYFMQMNGHTKIQATWKAAVAFIEWHNQQQNNPAIGTRSI